MSRSLVHGLAVVLMVGVCPATIATGASPIHPPVPLLDAEGQSVVKSGKPVSTMKSCAACHDTQYIAAHSYHVALGRNERMAMGSLPGRRPWDWSPGTFGRWSPLTYRYLSPPGDRRLDLGTAEWIQQFGARHVGGGPAWHGYGDGPLVERAAASEGDPDAHVLDPATGRPHPWDWRASGAVEMNCFLCHVEDPDNDARRKELDEGRFAWANTATLANTSVVRRNSSDFNARESGSRVQGDSPIFVDTKIGTVPVRREGNAWSYQADAFRADGTVEATRLGIGRPTSEHCGQCHGATHRGEEPLKLQPSLAAWSTATKGQVFSGQRISESAVNLKDRQRLTRPWDVHAERLMDCASCHFSLNHPAYYEPTPRTRPEHLEYEPRRLPLGEYVHRPSHQFAKGHTAQGTAARHLDGTMRRCDDCHNAADTHDWLPYRDVHFSRLSCEACHVAETYAPAIRQVDWTVPRPNGEPAVEWRGTDSPAGGDSALIAGFRPVLLPREDLDGRRRLVPHNLVAAWYWVEGGAAPRPVRLADLKSALLAPGGYHPEIIQALDTDRDGRIADAERELDTPEKVAAVRRRLEAVGVTQPHIEAEIQPYGLHHGVGPKKWATRNCQTCHTASSRLGAAMVLASAVPAGVLPRLVGDSGTELAGELQIDAAGQLVYRPSTREASLYVLGHDRWRWIDALGGLAMAGVVLGVAIHAGLRIRAGRRG